MKSTSQEKPNSSQITEETIQRAQEGVNYARDHRTNDMIAAAMLSVEALASGGSERKISGEVRQTVLRLLIRTLFQVKVEFSERIPTTPALVVSNHLNHIDPFLLLGELPPHPYYYILGDARTLYNHCWKRLFLRFAKGVIPLERIWKEEIAVMEAAKAGREDLGELAAAIDKYVPKSNSIETLRRIDRIVQGIFANGEGVLLFPEGRLGDTEGQLLPLKRGAAIYALRSGVPILPVALIGTQDLYFRKKLTIRFGKPLIFPQSQRPKGKEAQAVADTLQTAMMDLFLEEYHEPEEPKPLRDFLNHMFW
ncbi:MAG: lysophospholipid acyltransferase family protein [Nostocaceae cyanobacterium]|nr:lysophospholipid acyltransferase family protein [Nostocaceae cyanobacterium]